MKVLLILTSILSPFCLTHLASASVSQAGAYICVPSEANAPLDLVSVTLTQDSKSEITTELKFNSGIATLSYATKVTYEEDPKLLVPTLKGDGLSFITEKKARDFQASSFVGNLSGNTDSFSFTASLLCKKQSSPQDSVRK